MSSQELSRRRRILLICTLSCAVAVASVGIAHLLLLGINFCTNLFYYQTFSLHESSPAQNNLGLLAIVVPAIGGLIVGVMAKFGSASIRGHGIPEAMENILQKESRIPRRITFLKPISSAIAIGSGGPFGAEGPIIATGGALGSWLGQIVPVSPYERKIILASGAAAGMTAIFGTPLAAVLLAIELLLFEYRPKSFVPVALATVVAATLRTVFMDTTNAFFVMPNLVMPDMRSLFVYLIFGALTGVLAVIVTKSVYWVEDMFEHVPLHWMWWPALGGLAVGVIGLLEPRALGVGYDNITLSLAGTLTVGAAFSIFFWKFLAWSLALGSGTSGGTLAPILTLGSAFGFLVGTFLATYFPEMHTDTSTMALIGMAALFAGSSRALLASVLFALEGTKQPVGLVPLLGCCSIAYLISLTTMKNTIMTEKIVRRGLKVPHEYYGGNQP
ncbi:chloride channel protein [Bdellovibrio bacteriovorus]|uniref:chloride channel protein n=1 Tax=Bdellovibrio bacteriovorus TaxID=959 RepID=UPI0021CF5C95|nr:chloride channel protein [Bdellovibrio bacteriovorus]UXR63221.1 chloride channel protein [Bdellovibrio bacteriovorus]